MIDSIHARVFEVADTIRYGEFRRDGHRNMHMILNVARRVDFQFQFFAFVVENTVKL
jgi:hypothetical protein